MEKFKRDVSELENLELVNELERKVYEAIRCNDSTYRNKRVDIMNLKREITRRMGGKQ